MVDFETQVLKPEDPVMIGYTFAGWYLNDAPYDFNMPVTTNITLSAMWR
jgi:uncharacterized repeat protein (TIGR02543 family)